MELRDYLFYGCMWLVGCVAYSLFGLQIAIMNRCAKKLYYQMSLLDNFFDAPACKRYMSRTKRINFAILTVVTVLMYLIDERLLAAYGLGVLSALLLSIGRTGCNSTNIAEAAKMFMQFAKLGKEEEVKVALLTCIQNPVMVEKTPTPAEEKVEPWVVWCVSTMLIAAGAVACYGCLSWAKPQVETIYSTGKADGIAEINQNVEAVYGITPEEAYQVIYKYNSSALITGDGAPTMYEYQQAIQALALAGQLLGSATAP